MTVYLVGAGPGDPGLITVRGKAVLERADVVIYDRLSAKELLDYAPVDAELISVGKDPQGTSVSQDTINELLVEHGRNHDVVVRLKGGDPFIFARGAEEAMALEAAAIEYEVVPGITSAIAAPAYAGIPVTLRYSSTSLTIVTGHEDPTKPTTDVDWEAVARVGGTIVILMGVANINAITQRLLGAGLAPDTPAAAVRWGTKPNQHTIRATLDTLRHQPLAAPSTIVIGDVAAQSLGWFATRPLLGKTIVVTRARAQAGQFGALLRERGATVIEAPMIHIDDASDGGEHLRTFLSPGHGYEWVVITSPNGAQRFGESLRDARDLAGARVGVIGPGTAGVLESFRIQADLIPPHFVAESLVDVFPSPTVNGGLAKVAVVRAEDARDVVPTGLQALGWSVDIVPAYRTVAAQFDASQRSAIQQADLVTFTSSSGAQKFFDNVGADWLPAAVGAIGPITATTLRDAGVHVDVEATEHSLEGFIAAIESWAHHAE